MKSYFDSNSKYTIDLRSVYKGDSSVKNYIHKLSYTVNEEISFDIEHPDLTSLDYFTGSVASSIILSIIAFDQKNKQVVENIEGKFSFLLSNPLAYLNVRGYEGLPKITKIYVTLYIVSYEDSDLIHEVCNKALTHSILYQILRHSIDFVLSIKIIY